MFSKVLLQFKNDFGDNCDDVEEEEEEEEAVERGFGVPDDNGEAIVLLLATLALFC